MKQKKSIAQIIFKYLGEIIIIVIGVSISVAMNNSQNRKTEMHHAHELLTEIKNNLEHDTTIFSNYTKLLDRNIKWEIPLVMQNDVESLSDSLLFFVSIIPNYIPFTGTTIGYTHMQGSGGFRLIEDKTLLKEIIQIYSDDYARLAVLAESQKKYIHEQIIPFYNKNIPLILSRDLDDLGEHLDDFMTVIKSQEYRNIVRVHLSMLGQYSNLYKIAISNMENLLQKIEKEVEQD